MLTNRIILSLKNTLPINSFVKSSDKLMFVFFESFSPINFKIMDLSLSFFILLITFLLQMFYTYQKKGKTNHMTFSIQLKSMLICTFLMYFLHNSKKRSNSLTFTFLLEIITSLLWLRKKKHNKQFRSHLDQKVILSLANLYKFGNHQNSLTICVFRNPN